MVPLGANNQANLDNNRVRITNNHESSDEQKHRIMDIDHQERRKGKNFMKSVKRRWDLEFPESKRTTQNLVDEIQKRRIGRYDRAGRTNGRTSYTRE